MIQLKSKNLLKNYSTRKEKMTMEKAMKILNWEKIPSTKK
jgi:hypothetical protein